MNKTYYPLGLTIIASGLLIHGALNAHLVTKGLGLIHGLPITFFAGLGVLVIAAVYLWTFKEPQYILAGVQVLILVSALWLIPVFTGGTPPFTDHAYRNLRFSNYLFNHGSWSGEYLNWPGAFILTTGLSKILNLGLIINYIPYIIQTLCLVPLYIFLKINLNKVPWGCCFLGLWFFSLARWVGDSQLTPVSLAFLLLLILLALVSLISKYPSKKWLLGLAVLTFGLIVITHLPTSIAALLILGLFSLAKRNRKLIVVSTICLLIIVTWDMAYSGYMIDRLNLSPQVSASTLNSTPVTILVAESSLPTLVGSKDHQIVCGIRFLLSAVFVLVVAAGIIYSSRTKKDFMDILPFIAIVTAPLLLLIIERFYDTSMTERIYLYCLPGVAYFGSRLLEVNRKKLIMITLSLLLIITIPMHIVSTYGNQAMDYLSKNHIEGIYYTFQRFGQEFEEGEWGIPPLLDGFPLGCRYTIEQIQRGKPEVYVWLTSRDREWCKRALGNENIYNKCQATMDNYTDYTLIYSNPDFRLYKEIRNTGDQK